MFEFIGWIAYIAVCFLWGAFAVRMHLKIDYPKRWYNSVPIVFLLNFTFTPIAMFYALAADDVDSNTVVQKNIICGGDVVGGDLIKKG